jgi:putative transcriptional regulator
LNIRHHPTEVVLAGYASGALADGPSLTVSAHLDRCPACRARVCLFEQVGGALLADTPQAEMAPDALAKAFARLERPASATRASTPMPAPRHASPLGGIALSAALARREVGPRRWIGPGIWVAPVQSNAADGWRTYLLQVPKGVAIPHHGHNGPEFTVVLKGRFVDEGGVYGPGDFAESGEGLEHHPAVEGEEACVCLISGHGGVKATGLLRLIQPLIGV